MIMYKILYNLTGGDVDRSYVHCMLIYRGCLLVKNSFVNISEVNRQCLHSLGTRSEDDFEKVSIFSAFVVKSVKMPGLGVWAWLGLAIPGNVWIRTLHPHPPTLVPIVSFNWDFDNVCINWPTFLWLALVIFKLYIYDTTSSSCVKWFLFTPICWYNPSPWGGRVAKTNDFFYGG